MSSVADYLAQNEAELDRYEAALGSLVLPAAYVPVEPTIKQEWFLLSDAFETFFGGAAGPGKSWGLLMAALQYVATPGYHGLLLRPHLNEFEQPGGLIEVAHDWLDGTDAAWNGTRREWSFPGGASIRFGYLRSSGDLRQYKGPSYSFCGFDELTSFPEWAYRAMFRVLRQPRLGLEHIPVRMRSASNPGDIGHQWVKGRFIVPETKEKDAVYVRALIADNPYLDYETYVQTLSHLSPVDRERLIRGDWDVMEEGGKFKREDFIIVPPDAVLKPVRVVRYWDLAATEASPANTDPDYTAGLRLQVDATGTFTIAHLVYGRFAAHLVEEEVHQTALEDGRGVPVYVEQEPGASGKLVVEHFKRKVLQGFAAHAGLTRGGDKETRARPVAAAVANGLVQVAENCPHLLALLDEASIFPNGTHDDIVDALSGSHTYLSRGVGGTRTRSTNPNASAARVAVDASRR